MIERGKLIVHTPEDIFMRDGVIKLFHLCLQAMKSEKFEIE